MEMMDGNNRITVYKMLSVHFPEATVIGNNELLEQFQVGFCRYELSWRGVLCYASLEEGGLGRGRGCVLCSSHTALGRWAKAGVLGDRRRGERVAWGSCLNISVSDQS